MQVIYYKDSLPSEVTKSLFLAGPSKRPGQEGESWRREAIQILEDLNFDGVVFCPENQDGTFDEEHDYSETVEWEERMLNSADVAVFWIPRDLNDLPGFTTNVEYGNWYSSGKVILGYPEDAEKMQYLQYYADKFNVPTANTLKETLQAAIDFIGDGAERSGGECTVPYYIWKTPQFQSWYRAQTEAGNRLDSARLLYNFRPGNKKFVFLWILHCDMYVASEDRHKTNEFVLARIDISSVLMWQPSTPILNSKIVTVREYRSPASTPSGFIVELPGGSASEENDAGDIAAEEVFEETGLHLDPKRLTFEGTRQLAGTLSSHQGHLFSVQLTDEEMTWLQSQRDIAHGNIQDSEQTYIEIYSLQELLEKNLTDWSTIGQIASVLMKGDAE